MTEISSDMSRFLDELIERFGTKADALLPILQGLQREYRWLPKPLLEAIWMRTEITAADLVGVVSFYSQFRTEPVGQHLISVCTGTACHVKGALPVLDAFRQQLKLSDDQDTDATRLFTVEKIACLGCCTLAPVVQIDGVTYGHVTPTAVPRILSDFLATAKNSGRKQIAATPIPERVRGEIRIGLGSCCQAQGSRAVYDEAMSVVSRHRLPYRIKPVGCVGMCHQVPLVETVTADGTGTLFAQVRPDEVESILMNHCRPESRTARMAYRLGSWLERLWSDEFPDPVRARTIRADTGPVCSFLAPQIRWATEYGGTLRPTDFDEFCRLGGMEGLARAKELTSEGIIAELKRSGLRGRGGAGFATWRKWDAVLSAQQETKYVVVNGDEGDPGAFMDRMILESFPFRVLEGMMIAAACVGAKRGFLYIRAEYPLAVRRIESAIDELVRRGILRGEDANGDGLLISVIQGAGAFVCGEETALLESIEGKRGMPRLRPPFPATSGLWGRPTLVNNVETFALVPSIFRRGGEAFGNIGTEKSRGTKVFALAGKVNRGGLIEVPMGISLRTIVETIGGGIADGRRFKGVQIGGPSGGCVPADRAETPVDYESLAAAGAIMGSGGLVVLDESDCMVDMARYFLRFTQEQSCGKCTFCRVGTRRMLEILDRLCDGKGGPGDLEQLEILAHAVSAGSLCGLGKTAPNPVLSTLTSYRDEYEAHLRGVCPAGKCPKLTEYQIIGDCDGCTLCAQACPTGAIEAVPYRRHRVEVAQCTHCGACVPACPKSSVEVRSR